MGPTETLARFIAELRYDHLPREVVEAAKVGIQDGVANMLGGSTQPFCSIIADYVRELGGAERCSVAGWDFKTNAPSAAFANGVFGHCLDFEIQGYPPTHGTSSCLPAALALGEEYNASGRKFIEAYVVGWEIQGRLREASYGSTVPAYHPPGLFGPLGSAASSARVLDLSIQHTRYALGIAASRTGGLTANTGTMVKSTHPGNAARMGVEAALLAKAGYVSNEDILEARAGYAAALFNDQMDWELLTKHLGDTYRLVEPGFDVKAYPAQIYMQRPIEAVLDLRKRHSLSAGDVEHVTVQMLHPERSGSVPRSGLDGKFNIEYCVAAALLDGHVGIDTFTDERRFSPAMEETMAKVRVDSAGQSSEVARVTARLRNGAEVKEECRHFRGSAANPMSHEENMVKFRGCVERVLSPDDTIKLARELTRLEEVEDISAIMGLLCRGPKD